MITKFLVAVMTFTFFAGCGQSPFIRVLKDPESSNEGSKKGTVAGKVLRHSGLVIQLYWRNGPMVTNESKALLVVLTDQGVPQNLPDGFTIKIDMPHMSHPNWPVKIKNQSVGTYELSEIFFTMEGFWTLNIDIEDGNKNKIEGVQWEYNL